MSNQQNKGNDIALRDLMDSYNPLFFTHFEPNQSLSIRIAKEALKLGKATIADDYFKKSIIQEPHNPGLLYDYAQFLTNQMRIDESIEMLEKVISLNNNDFAFKQLVINYLKKQDYKRAYLYTKKISSNTQYLISLIEQSILNIIKVDELNCSDNRCNEVKKEYGQLRVDVEKWAIGLLENLEDFWDIKSARIQVGKAHEFLDSLQLENKLFEIIPESELLDYCYQKYRWDIEYKQQLYKEYRKQDSVKVDNLIKDYFTNNYVLRMNNVTGLNKQALTNTSSPNKVVLYDNDLDRIIKSLKEE